MTPGIAAHQAPLTFPVSWSLLRFMSIELVMLSKPSNPLPPAFPFAFKLSQHQGFSIELALCIRWPKYWSFSPYNAYSGLISFSIYRLDLLTVQGTLKSLLQHHSLKASILHCSAFFMVQLSHPYMTTGKTIALTRWTFVSKVMSLPFNTLSRFV